MAAVGPLKANDDLPRSRRPADITEAARTRLIGEACASQVQRDHEYTVTLSAAVDLVTRLVHHAITHRHRSREFVAFFSNSFRERSVSYLF
jgi:hypothetical protein